jgi:nucleoside-diphosphate-sugar epimerase
MRQTNRLRTEGTRNLVRAAERVGATRFVTQSMLFGYGYGDAGGRVRTEDDEFAPRGAGRFEEHLAAMRLNEDLVLRSGAFDGIALRYGLFYGVGAGDTDLVASLRRRRLPVVREAGPLSWIYVEDAATATLAALVAGEGGEAYNVVDDEPVSWTTLMTELAAAIGAPRPPALPRWALPALPYAGVVLRGGVCATNLKARSKLRWAPAVPTYRDGIRRIAAAHR